MNFLITKKKTLIFLLIVVILTITAFLLRARIFLEGDFYFLPDQARDLMLTKEMLETQKLTMIGARAMSGGYIFHGPMWIWMLSIPMILFSGNPFYIAFTTYFFIGLGIVLLGIFVAYKLYGRLAAVFAGIFLSISSMLVANISSTTNAHLLPLVFIPFIYFLISYIRGNKRSIYFASFFAGLGVQFEGVFAVPLFVFLLITSIVTDRYVLKIKNIFITLFTFSLPLMTFIIFDLRHDFLMSTGLFRLLTDGKGLGSLPGYEQYGDLGFRISDRLNGLYMIPSYLMYSYDFIVHLLLIAMLIGGVLMIFKSKNKQLQKEIIVLLSLPFFMYIVFLYFQYPIWPHYIFGIPVIAAFIFAVAARSLWNIQIGKVFVAVTLVLLVIPVGRTLLNYLPLENSNLNSDGSYKNQLAVADFIFNDAKSQKFGYFVYSPQVFTYGMDYLLWWRGKEKYGYIPDSNKNKIFYLIMYPPLENDKNAHNYWIKNVIRTKSKIVDRQIFSGGIVVEKRMLENEEDPVDPNYYLNVR